ncbi:MAG: hypothetical protein IJV36_07550 [Prevotella sp.]|nr:hypothetical protein [Prevotella sp.]
MRKIFIAIIAIVNMYLSAPAYAVSIPIPLEEGYVDPTIPHGSIPKSPVRVPSVSLDDYTLYFFTPCDGCVLNLVDENGVVVYSLVIPEDTASLELPAELSGEYELQILRGNYCFWGRIELDYND